MEVYEYENAAQTRVSLIRDDFPPAVTSNAHFSSPLPVMLWSGVSLENLHHER